GASLTVAALDAFDNPVPGYRGTVHFTSTDPQAMLPADYAFTAADAGSHTFGGVTLKTAGVHAITATDAAAGLSGTQAPIYVAPAAATRLAVSGYPSPATAGTFGAVLVAALDPFGNVDYNYTGTVHLATDDPSPFAYVGPD